MAVKVQIVNYILQIKRMLNSPFLYRKHYKNIQKQFNSTSDKLSLLNCHCWCYENNLKCVLTWEVAQLSVFLNVLAICALRKEIGRVYIASWQEVMSLTIAGWGSHHIYHHKPLQIESPAIFGNITHILPYLELTTLNFCHIWTVRTTLSEPTPLNDNYCKRRHHKK